MGNPQLQDEEECILEHLPTLRDSPVPPQDGNLGSLVRPWWWTLISDWKSGNSDVHVDSLGIIITGSNQHQSGGYPTSRDVKRKVCVKICAEQKDANSHPEFLGTVLSQNQNRHMDRVILTMSTKVMVVLFSWRRGYLFASACHSRSQEHICVCRPRYACHGFGKQEKRCT